MSPDEAAQAARREVAELWEAVFGEPSAADADVASMLEQIVSHLETKDYARLHAAERAHGIVWPRYHGAARPRIISF